MSWDAMIIHLCIYLPAKKKRKTADGIRVCYHHIKKAVPSCIDRNKKRLAYNQLCVSCLA